MYNTPMNTNKMTPKDFFMHVGIIITLYVSSVSLITLLFQIINIAYPDNLYGYSDPYSFGIRWAIASLIIIFPIFVFLSWLVAKECATNPEKRMLGIRRWLTFLTLFIAGATVITNLIVLLNSFLGGEISTRFILKVVAVLVVSGLVFAYYLWDLRHKDTSGTQSPQGTQNGAATIIGPKMFGIAASILVLASVVSGFVVMGSPFTQRQMRLDDERVGGLQTIQWQIVNFWQQKGTLPSSLADLNDPISGFVAPTDPGTSEQYVYKKISNLDFELCATFDLESRANQKDMSYAYPAMEFGQDNWQHSAGLVCFDRKIDPELYPVTKSITKPIR